jgi:murein DD-endopeptidase MepM/ murein hydrolase activator NlpD
VPVPRLPAAILVVALLAASAVGCSQAKPQTTAETSTKPELAAQAAPSGVASPNVAPSASGSTAPGIPHVFPVIGKYSYGHDHHDYPATDIITACGNKVVATVSGVILETTRVDTWTAKLNLGATRGGLSVSILGDDGVRYYGSHLRMILDDIQPGTRVTMGQQLGEIGETGDASACHLHFGISPPCQQVGDWWIQRGVIWPWSYLDSWRSGGNKNPVPEIVAWQKKNGCPTKPLVDP